MAKGQVPGVARRGEVVMSKTLSVAASTALVALSLGISTGTVGAADDYDSANQREFWQGAAQAADFTVYAPSRAAVNRAGLETVVPPTMSSMTMVCAGQWTVVTTFDGGVDSNSQLTLTQALSPQCMDDPGAGDAPRSPWSFVASGNRFRALYQGCRNIGEGQQDPGVTNCPVADRIYFVSGKLPGASGEPATAVRVETVGVTRTQIRGLVRALEAVR